jgi:hypothetical protein
MFFFPVFYRRSEILPGNVGTPKLQSNDGCNVNAMKAELRTDKARTIITNHYKLTKPVGKHRHRLIENDYSSGKGAI